MSVGERLVGDFAAVGVGVLGTTTIGGGAATPRQRALVAALALAGQRGAEIGELADEVWSGRPPRSSRASLQNQMTRLRRLHGDDLIVCDQARYRLTRPTDVELFEQTVAGARATFLTPGVADSLAGALALWRGLPYVDLPDSHAAEVERARLAETRGRAADLLALGRIRLGDLERGIAELRVEVENDPLRDRAWELLCVALQRADRVGEALAVHRTYVARLRDHFGVEPSQRLVEAGRALRRGIPLEIDLRPEAGDVASPDGAEPLRGACCHRPPRRRCGSRSRRRTRRVDP